ncbi:MAG: tetratricopeptide repeat protein [Bryobacterales bacterium]|nr:tetratricopeptide repeat protein [Bryobacterales bacterium]
MARPRKGRDNKVFGRLGCKARIVCVMRAGSVWFLLITILQLLPGAPQPQVPAGAVGEFNRALDHFRTGNYGDALRVIEPLGSRHPEVAEIQHLLAIILDLNRRPEEANQHFRRAVELQPTSVVLRTNFGASLMRLGQASAAAEQFREALELEPNHPTASFNLGTILLQQGDPEQALPWLEKAFSMQPDVYQNAYQLAYCQLLLGMYEETAAVVEKLGDAAASRAEVRFLEALTERALGRADRTQAVLQEIRPLLNGQPQLQFQAALLLLSQDLLEPSEELLRSVTRDLPGFYPAHLNLALAQQRLGRLPEATETAQAALNLEETAQIHSLMADLMEAQGKPVEAVTHFQQAVALEPTSANYFALGYEFLAHWNWEEAAQVFAAGLERERDSWHLWIGSGAAALGLTRYEEATQAFLKAVELKPEELMGYHLLAQAFDRSDTAFDAALSSFRGLLQREPENPWARYFEALGTFREGARSADSSQMAARVETLTQLTREDSGFLEALLLLSEIQFELRNWAETVEALQRAIELDPNHVSAHYRLGLALQRLGQSQEAREILQRYQALKTQEDQTVGERVAVTTRFIVGLKRDDELR